MFCKQFYFYFVLFELLITSFLVLNTHYVAFPLLLPIEYIRNLRNNCSLLMSLVYLLRHTIYILRFVFLVLQIQVNYYKIQNSSGEDIIVVQIAGLIARRIVCPLKVGDEVKRGFDFGMIRFGSQTEIIIPSRDGIPFKSTVKVGDKVQGGKTVLGDWIK